MLDKDKSSTPQFFEFVTLGDGSDESLAFFRDSPKGLELRDFYLRQGILLGEYYPKNAELLMDSKTRGQKLSSFLGNTLNMLIVHTAMKNVIEEVCENDIEYLPVCIINHKGEVESGDYWFINPIGVFDCVDRTASDIDFDIENKSQILGVTHLVLLGSKLADAPHLFRVPEKKSTYFLSAKLVKALSAHDFTNIILKRVDVA